MGFKVGDDSGGGMSEINVTPLIDIMLVMLIIFMIITPPAISQMAAKLPEKTESIPQQDVPKDQLVAAVCKDGTYALNRTVMPLEDVRRQVARRLRPKAKKVVSDAIEVNKSQVVPDWLSVSGEGIQTEVVAVPRREHVPHPIQEQLIIELCSK